MMCAESPLTRIPGAWADRHPMLASALVCAVFAAFVIAIASTAHAQNAATISVSTPSLTMHCALIIGSPAVLTIDTRKREITVASDVKTDDAARLIFDALRPYLDKVTRPP